MVIPPKEELKAELLRALSTDLETLERAMQSAREGATHEEAKPENDKDTRALEQSYLARGQALRIDELKTGIADVRDMVLRAFREGQPAALGAVIRADEDGAALVFFLAPHGGGAKLVAGGVQVVTPKSPLGRALLGKQAGDDCEVPLAGRIRSLSLVSVE